MFKAKLINNKKYYKYRGLLIVFSILLPIVFSLFTNFQSFSNWTIALIIIVYISLVIISFKFIKQMNSMIGKEIIEIDNNEIRVKAIKSSKQEIIPVASIEKITLKKVYGIPQESMKDIAKEFKGKPKENYIIIENGNGKRRFDFEIDSYYMIDKLNKIISHWEATGYKLEKI